MAPEPYAYTTYAGRVGETFQMRAGGTNREATLLSVTPHGADAVRGFSLVFRAAGEVVEQQTCTFSHPACGDVDLFVVPITAAAGGADYEAIITRVPDPAS